jgi:DNA topoisomerase-1
MERDYVVEQKRFLVPTQIGNTVVDGLCGRFAFIEYAFTRQMEESLDDIASGKAAYVDVMRGFDERLRAEVAAAGSAGARYPCPDCGRALRLIKGPRGTFWGCTGFSEGCAVTCADDNGKPGAVTKRSGQASMPSEKQLELARKLATDSGDSIPDAALTDAKALNTWINGLLAKKGASQPSEAQMKWVKELVGKGSRPPPGWPGNVTTKGAKEFLDREFKKNKRDKNNHRTAPNVL